MKLPNVRQLGVLCLCLASVLVCTFFGCGQPAAGQPEEFRGIKWGAEASSVSGLSQIAGEGNLALYEKGDDRLQMGEVRLDQVIYGFYKGRFYMGMAYFQAVGFKRIEEMLTRQLGQPAKPDNTPSRLIWDGDNVSVLLTVGDNAGQGRLIYIYKPIQLEVELKK